MSGPVSVVGTFPKNAKETLRVALDEFKGHRLIDLRACVLLTESSGVLSPTKAGVSLNVSKLPELIEALQQAERQARDMGWIGSER